MHESPVRIVALTLVGTSFGAGACSSDGTSTMSESDAGGDVAKVTLDGAAVIDSTPTPDVSSMPDVAVCSLEPIDSGTCNALMQRASLVTSVCSSQPLPAAVGGVIEDGTYLLESLTYFAGVCPPSPDLERITWVVCGTQWELVEDLNATDGGSHIVRLNLTRETQGNLLSSNIICQPGTVQSTMGPAQAYTASPGHFVVQVKSPNGTRVDSFVKL